MHEVDRVKRILWLILTGCTMAISSYLVGSGRLAYAAAALIVAVSPIAIYLFLSRPYLTLYGLYVALIPFDTLLEIPAFGTVSKLVGLVAGAALLVYGLRLKHFNPPPLTVLAWAIYVCWCAATAMWAIVPETTIRASATLAQLFLLYTIVATAPISRSQLRTVVAMGIIGGVIAGTYGAWMFYHQQNSLIAQAQQALDRLQLQSGDVGVDANHFADALIFPAVALIVWFLKADLWWNKAIFAVGLACVLAGIYFSAARETLVALGCVVIYFLFAAPHYRKQLGIVASFALALTLATPMVWQRFSQAMVNGGSGRFSIWSVGLRSIPDHWFDGAGFANFAAAYNERYLSVFQSYRAGWYRPAHDILLSTIVELGIIGLILLGLAFATQFKLLSHIGSDDDLYDYRLMVNGAFIGVLVVAFFIDLMTYKYLWYVMATGTQVYAVWTHRRMVSPTYVDRPLRASVVPTA